MIIRGREPAIADGMDMSGQNKVYKWVFRADEDRRTVPAFFKEAGVPEEAARIMMRRGVKTKEDLHHFLSDTLADLSDPFLMKGMKEAVTRIMAALSRGERIVIYGDYDVDGITSTSVLYRCLASLSAKVSYYIPSREGEGYGLNAKALSALREEGNSLLITVDCGISSADLIADRPAGLDIIVTDHHMPPEHLPESAVAVVNPHQEDCPYPYKELAGVGVSFSLCRALWQKEKGEDYRRDVELVALGTIADVVSLTGENRTLVREGLKRFPGTKIKGLAALLQVSGLDGKEVSAERVSFTLAPRLNAAGRVAHARKGVELMTTESDETARTLAETLQETNTKRQTIERDIFKQAKERVLALHAEKDWVLVVDGAEWHPGVIGIVASRLMEAYHRPVLMISVKDGVGKGSCRSISTFNIYEALAAQGDILLQYGGHKMAAGFSIEAEKIPLLRERLNAYGRERLTEEDCIPRLEVEEKLPLRSVTIPFIRSLDLLEPCGCDNPKPLFATMGMHVDGARRIGAERNHFKCTLSQGYTAADGVFWNAGDDDPCREGDQVSAVYDPQIHLWHGEQVQLVLKDMKKEEGPALDRDTLVAVYLHIRTDMREGTFPEGVIMERARNRFRSVYTPESVAAALTVLRELGLIVEGERGAFRYRPSREKLDLSMSPTYRRYHR